MKKIYTLLGAALITTSSFSQVNSIFNQEKTLVNSTENQDEIERFIAKKALITKNSFNQNNKGPVDGRADYAAELFNLAGGVRYYNYINLLLTPDSTTTVSYEIGGIVTNGEVNNLHGIGMVYDPTDLFFGDKSFTRADQVDVDSLFIDGFYKIFNAAHTTDSIIFRVFVTTPDNTGALNFITFSNLDGLTNATTSVPFIDYTGNAAHGYFDGITATHTARYGYQLSPNDTANISTMAVETPGLSIPPGSVMAVFVEYIPSDSNPGDEIDFSNNTGDFNPFRPFVLGNDPQTSPNFTNFTGLDNGSFQHNTIHLTNATRYDGTVTSTNHLGGGIYALPRRTYSIYATVSGNSSVGINEENNNVKFNVFPNPSNGVFNIYLSSNDDSNVNLTVKNVVGQTVLTETVNVSGSTNHRISLTDYSKGIYFLTVGNETTKLIVE